MELDLECNSVDSTTLEHGCRMTFLLWFGVGGRSCSSFLASTVRTPRSLLDLVVQLGDASHQPIQALSKGLPLGP